MTNTTALTTRKEIQAYWKMTGLETAEGRTAKKLLKKAAKLSGQHVDHIMPLALGGPDLAFNLQVLSEARNLKKGATFPEADQKEYAKRLAGLTPEYRAQVEMAQRILKNGVPTTTTTTAPQPVAPTPTHEPVAPKLQEVPTYTTTPAEGVCCPNGIGDFYRRREEMRTNRRTQPKGFIARLLGL